MSAARGRRLAVALSALALGGAAPEPPCRTSVSVEPSAVVVGQQAIYRLRILRREDVSVVHWEESLSFPSFRSEALPSRAPGPEVREVGDGYLVFEERRALFPARSGELSIPPARLRCTVGRGAQRRELIAAVPPARLRVEPLPGAGRPDGFTGLVGPVRANVSLSTERLRLGETVSLTVTLRGPGNVWSAEPPYDAARDFPGVDVFPRPATLHREAGDRLVVRRGFGFDLVPRQTGTLEIPATRIAYFDPEAGSYAAVELPAHRVQVAEAAATAPPAPREPRAAAPLPVALREPSWTPLVWVGGALTALAGLAAAAVWLARRMLRARAARARIERALAAAQRAEANGDGAAAASALATALRAALEARVPGARALAAEELLERCEDDVARAVAEALAALDRARFRPGAAPSLDAARARELVGRL